MSSDIGGTKTLLQLSKNADVHKPLLRKSYSSKAYENLETILEEFLFEADIDSRIEGACFALAGPVKGRKVELTNLPWVVDGDALTMRFSFGNLALINDFEAIGYGIDALQSADILTLQKGLPQEEGVRLVVGAGTGLGVSWCSSCQGTYQVHPSEGGHIDFAPANVMQSNLLVYLQQRYGHVSYERIVSGPGLVAIYEFLRDTGLVKPSEQMIAALLEGDMAETLAIFSQKHDEEIALLAMEIFLSVYGAFVGSMALASLPRGGIFIAGGIAAKIADQMQNGKFKSALLNKGRFSDLLSAMPVHIVINSNVGLIGANIYAQNIQANSAENKKRK